MSSDRKASLRDSLLDQIGNFLYQEGFMPGDQVIKLGILEIVNLISDYHEEGKPLFPEILITNDLDCLKKAPSREVVINNVTSTVEGFRNAVKLCAPLAKDGWVIFIEVKSGILKYGLTSAEMSVTSVSMYNQLVGTLKDPHEKIPLAFIRNIGQKTVELRGVKSSLIASLTLDLPSSPSSSEIALLSKAISIGCDSYKDQIATYFEKILTDALRDGHGNLIAVVHDGELELDTLKKTITAGTGVYLEEPIDLQLLIKEAEESNSNESAVSLINYTSLLKGMVNHDGIIVISDKARVIGYHLLIDNYTMPEDVIVGGSRSRAFVSMQRCGAFAFCFYKSQDGNSKIWRK